MTVKVRSLDFSDSIAVEIEDSHNNKSRIEFRRKLARDQRLEIADLNKSAEGLSESERADRWAQYIYDQILSIEGLSQGGKPITIEMLRAGEVYTPVLVLIQKCYLAAIEQDGEEIEKKDLGNVA